MGAEGVGGSDVVREFGAGIQEDEWDGGDELAHGLERAVVEALENDLVLHVMLLEELSDLGSEPDGVCGGVHFGFDHEAGLGLARCGEDVRGAADLGDLCAGEVGDGVVVDNDLTVFGDGEIEFEDVAADG